MDLFIAAYVLYAVLQAWWCADICLKVKQIKRDDVPLALLVNFVLAPAILVYILWCLFLNWRDSKK